jgi:hypothetical protein
MYAPQAELGNADIWPVLANCVADHTAPPIHTGTAQQWQIEAQGRLSGRADACAMLVQPMPP